MNQVYASWTNADIISKDEQLSDFARLPVRDGKKNSIDLIAKDNFSAVVPLKNGTADINAIELPLIAILKQISRLPSKKEKS